MSVYAPLQRRLSTSPQPVVRLSFEEIEQVLGRKLPSSARNARIKRQWWANTETHVQARAWLTAGRRARLDATMDEVVFEQTEPETTTTMVLDVGCLSPIALAAIRRRAQVEGSELGSATVSLLNELALERRKTLLSRIDGIRARTADSSVSVVDLIREDRDGR